MGPLSFASPGSLVWFLPLAGIVLALYVLRMRRRELRVPATFLWPAQTEEVRANALFQRLRPSWLLFLQLLAVGLAVLCLARPQTRQRGLAGEVTVLVLDSSASMSATDVAPSRFAEAKRLAREAILSAKPGDRLALVEAGPTPRVVFPLGSDPIHQAAALDEVQGTEAAADVGEALRLGSAIVANTEGARIVLLSDGDFEPIKDFSPGKASVVYQYVGKGGTNLGIDALGVSDTPKGRLLFAGVRNYGAQPWETTLSLYADGKAVDSLKLKVGPKSSVGHTIPVPAGVHLFEAKIDPKDVLKADDYAAVSADPAASLHVLRVGPTDPFLNEALRLDPRVTLDQAAKLPPDGGASYDVVAFDGVPAVPAKSRGVLVFGRAGPETPVEVQGKVKRPRFVAAESAGLMKGVDLEGVYIDSSERVAPRGAAEVLARSSAGPLVVAERRTTQKTVYVAFSPLQSDFPLQVGFPIFVGNALTYLGGDAGDAPLVTPAGRVFSLPVVGDRASLIAPDGGRTELRPLNGAVTLREIQRTGRYQVEADGKKRAVIATLMGSRESDVAPVAQVALADHQVKSMAAPLRFADFWRPLALLCLLVLGGEWWLYARRS